MTQKKGRSSTGRRTNERTNGLGLGLGYRERGGGKGHFIYWCREQGKRGETREEYLCMFWCYFTVFDFTIHCIILHCLALPFLALPCVVLCCMLVENKTHSLYRLDYEHIQEDQNQNHNKLEDNESRVEIYHHHCKRFAYVWERLG